jgi:hypothetical protein
MMLGLGSLIAVASRPVQDDETRKLWDDAFLKKRGKSSSPARPQGQPRYKRATAAPGATASGDAVVGITIWRLRPAKAADDKEVRILVHEKDKKKDTEWTPERIEADTPLKEGDRVRLSIEAPRTGYLYVIDREQYADGSFSDPYLIFPVTSVRGGDNSVTAGRVIEIPAQTDDPPYFLLKRSRPDQVSELLSVLVTSEPIRELRIGSEAFKLPKEQLAVWETKWGVIAERIELIGGAGQAYTRAEKAAANSSQKLTQDDPLPQTIYRVAAKPGDPLMVKVPLKISQ